jgi:ParB family chromosome partitioning protein
VAIISADPFRCRVWSLHDRLEEHVTEETCKEEIGSFLAHGQLVPALGRVLKGDPDYDIEIIYGARRLFIARHVNKPLRVELREMTDRDAIIAMDIENRQRADISPYERGLSYSHWLRCGHFNSQGEIARALHTSASQVSRLLKLARLPAVVVSAFSSPVDIREEWGLELAVALDDQSKRQATIRAARAVAACSPRLPPGEVFRRLLAAVPGGRKARARSHDEVVRDDDGLPLFRIRQRRCSLAVLLPVQKVSEDSIREIRRALVSILQNKSGPQADIQQSASNRRIQSVLMASD